MRVASLTDNDFENDGVATTSASPGWCPSPVVSGLGQQGTEPASLRGALWWLARHPWDALVRRWNYKSAVLSACVRSLVFFAANASAGLEAAMGAMAAEFCFRFATAGFYGAMTQAFRRVEPAAAGTLAATILLPLAAHSLELAVHAARGTPELAASVAASVALTVFSTAFNLFAMRRGCLVVGAGRESLAAELAAMPRLVALFIRTTIRTFARVRA